MKKIIIKSISTILLSITIFTTQSCSWLDQEPFSVVDAEQIEDSDDGADMWLTGVYNGLTRMFVYDEFPRCIEFDCDYISGPTWAFDEAGSGNFQGSTLQVDPAWKLTYELINRANEAIYHVEKMQNTTEAHKNNVLGEMYFLKAWGYFMLVRLYGEIPVFYTSINQGNDPKQPRQPIPVVYEHIVELLNQSKELTYKNTNPSFKQGHICAGSAAALLSKVYLTIASSAKSDGTITVRGGIPLDDDKNFRQPQNIRNNIKQVKGYESFDVEEYYTKAMILADSVIKQHYGNHDLLPYPDLWSANSKRDSREHLFSVHFVSGDDQLGSLFPSRFSGQIVNGVIPGSGGGLWFGMRNHWYSLFDEENDLRVIDGIYHRWVRESEDKYNGGSYYPNTNTWSVRAKGYYISASGDTIDYYIENGDTIKYEMMDMYKDGRTYSSGKGENYLAYMTKYADVTNPALVRTDGMYPFLRFADVLLIYAEASNEINRVTADGLEAYNRVRRRSNALEMPLNNFTQTSFRSAIIEERAMEFATEGGDRRFDLIRFGIYLDVMNAIGGLDEVNNSKLREEKHLLYPIPQDEILTNSAIAGNNPGWN